MGIGESVAQIKDIRDIASEYFGDEKVFGASSVFTDVFLYLDFNVLVSDIKGLCQRLSRRRL